MDSKTPNPKAWWLVLPVVLLVAFNAILPLMTVVNYSVQETFGDNVFFFEGMKWFQEVLRSDRFHQSLQNLKEALELHLAGEDLATMGLAPDPTILVTLELVPTHA
jgi:hypothetical protein